MLLPAAAKVVQFVLRGRKKCKKIIFMDLQLCWCLPDEIAHEKGIVMEIFLLSLWGLSGRTFTETTISGEQFD